MAPKAKITHLYRPLGKSLSPDLLPRLVKRNPLQRIKQGRFSFEKLRPSREELIEKIAQNSDILVSTNILERGLVGRSISVTTTPTRVIDGQFMRGYILLNPSSASGALTTSGTVAASATRAVGTTNTQAVPLGVGNYRKLKLFLNISAITATPTLTVNAQSQDPISLNWAETQGDIFAGASTVGTFHADIGDFGVDNSFALEFVVAGAGADITFSVGFVLKDGLIGSSTGVANTIYLGGPDVNSNTGLPLLEGQKERYWARPNAELYAVSLQPLGVTMNVFDLQ